MSEALREGSFNPVIEFIRIRMSVRGYFKHKRFKIQ